MRLGQLARKLNLSPTELVNYLSANNIQAAEGSNTRLDNELVKLVVRHFDPGGLVENIAAEHIPAELPAEEINIEVPVETDLPVSLPDAENVAEIISEEEEPKNVVEVIKAPKVELAGLKVLGKIELPQPRKKETPAPEQEATGEQPLPQEKVQRPERRRNINTKPERRGYSSGKNPIAAQREREAREAEQKREEQLKIEKERRTQYYLQQVKTSGPTKPARLIDEQVVDITTETGRAKRPATWLGRFWKWYRS